MLVSNKSLNGGTLSRFKRSFTPCRTRDMKIQNFPSRNHQKNLLSHMTHSPSDFSYNACKNLLCLSRQYKQRNISHLKHFLTPYRIRDKNQFLFSNFTSQNRDNNKCCVACRVENNTIQVRLQALFMSGASK